MVRKLRTLMNGVFISLVFICPSLSLAETVQISTVNDLKSFATRVNSGETSLDAVLTTNITLNDSWTPIGSSTYKYAGHFNGKGHSVSGLNVVASDASGFFGYIKSSTIDSLHVSGTVKNTSSNTGAICGKAENSVIAFCSSNAEVSGDNRYIGGICGNFSGGSINFCRNEGNVSSTKKTTHIGGICGIISAGSILGCSNYGTISAKNFTGVGGISGANSSGVSVMSCFNSGIVTGNTNVGGISGNSNANAKIENCLNVAMINGAVLGAIAGAYSSVSNCFYLKDPSFVGVLDAIDASGNVEAVTSAKLSSGEIAYLLGLVDTVWGQRLTMDETPQLNAPRVIKVSVDAESNGSVDGPNGYCNAPVTVSAIPNDGYVFDSWSNGDTTQQLVLVQDADLKASFVEGVGVTLYNGNDEGMDILWNPNRIFSPQGNQLLFVETDAIRGNNVIVDGTCTTVLLKDGAPFYTPSAFKAENLIYDRSLSPGSVSSFVLPFSVDVDKIGGDVYKFIKADDSTFYFKMVEDATEANVPYLVSVPGDASGALLPDGCVDAVIEGGAPVGVRASQITHFGDYQTHKYTSSVATSYLGLSKGKLLKAKEGVSVTNNPFRTAFSMENIKMLALSAFALNFDGEVGGVALLDSEDPFTALVDVYDVNGRMVRANVMAATCLQSLPNGIYIVGGRKFAVRNGQSSGCSRLKSANPDIVSE